MDWKKAGVAALKELVKLLVISLVVMIPIITAGLSVGKVDWMAVASAGAIAALNALNEFFKKWDDSSYNGIMGQ